LLQAASSIRVTRSLLASLQQDFAVDLIREHLQGGRGAWLTRYGDARAGRPGSGGSSSGGGGGGGNGI
ncbi:unnamed protein product, partial [Phaeothamnion confervicola]